MASSVAIPLIVVVSSSSCVIASFSSCDCNPAIMVRESTGYVEAMMMGSAWVSMIASFHPNFGSNVASHGYLLRYCRNVRPTWVKFDSKDTKESGVVFEVLSTKSKKRT